MRIISKFKDYYDRYASFDKNEKIWLRNKAGFTTIKQDQSKNDSQFDELNLDEVKEIIHKLNIITPKHFSIEREKHFSENNLNPYIFVFMGYFAFCGKLIPFVNVRDDNLVKYSTINETFYDYDSFLSFSERNNFTELFDKVFKPSFSFDERRFFRDFTNGSYFEKAEIFLGQKNKSTEALHQLLKSPVILFNLDKWYIVDAVLKDFDFVKYMTPDICFQELELYINNNLLTLDEREEFCDLTKIESHGFDKKTSFRKAKTKK